MWPTGNTLFAVVDSQDPFMPSLVAGEKQAGPILSTMAARMDTRPFNLLFLFYTPDTQANALETQSEVEQRHPECQVMLHQLPGSTSENASLTIEQISRRVRQALRMSKGHENHVCMSSGAMELRRAIFYVVATQMLPVTLHHIGSPEKRLLDSPKVKKVRLRTPGTSCGSHTIPEPEPQVELLEPGPPPALTSRYPELAEALKERNICIRSAVMRKVAETIAEYAPTDRSILILGETGTGKDVFAKLAHRLSHRRDGIFLKMNCAAKPENLLESELFGYAKGAFSGAETDRKGVFEVADKGTLFLDEIGEFTNSSQAKLLWALEEGEIQPLGVPQPLKVDVRIIAATNVDIKKAVMEKRFRDDLFYRFWVTVTLPPLRERREDLREFIERFLKSSTPESEPQKKLSHDALARLLEHPWPGNLRELERVIGESVRCAKGDIIEPEHLKFFEMLSEQEYLRYMPVPGRGFDLKEYLRTVRAHLIHKALSMCNGNQSQAAELLGISKQRVSEFLSELDNQSA